MSSPYPPLAGRVGFIFLFLSGVSSCCQMCSMKTKIIYLDVETGGLLNHHSLLEIAMHTEVDGKLQSWSSKIRHHDFLIDPTALFYNQIDLRESINWPKEEKVGREIFDKFKEWNITSNISENPKDRQMELVACGFNVKFDVDRVNSFLRCFSSSEDRWFSHRVLDLTSVAIFHGIPCKSHELINK